MLDRQRHVFFAHIPKTGGNSIEHAHGFVGSRNVPYRHQREADLPKGTLEDDVLRFAVIRNTYNRLASTYTHLIRSILNMGFQQYPTFIEYLKSVKEYHEGREFCYKRAWAYADESDIGRTPPILDFKHVEKLSWWFEGTSALYLRLRFDFLNDDYRGLISPKTNILNIPKVNRTPKELKEMVEVCWSAESIDIIEEIYAQEIKDYEMKRPI